MGPRQQLKHKHFLEAAQMELVKEEAGLKECIIEGCNKRKRTQSFSIVTNAVDKDIANETVTFWSENKHKRCSQVPMEDSNGGWYIVDTINKLDISYLLKRKPKLRV